MLQLPIEPAREEPSTEVAGIATISREARPSKGLMSDE